MRRLLVVLGEAPKPASAASPSGAGVSGKKVHGLDQDIQDSPLPKTVSDSSVCDDLVAAIQGNIPCNARDSLL